MFKTKVFQFIEKLVANNLSEPRATPAVTMIRVIYNTIVIYDNLTARLWHSVECVNLYQLTISQPCDNNDENFHLFKFMGGIKEKDFTDSAIFNTYSLHAG